MVKGATILLLLVCFMLGSFAIHHSPFTIHRVAEAAQIYPKASKKLETLTAEKLLARLDKLEEDEQQFLQAMEEIKSQLAIIKTRAAIPKRVINQLSSGAECP